MVFLVRSKNALLCFFAQLARTAITLKVSIIVLLGKGDIHQGGIVVS